MVRRLITEKQGRAPSSYTSQRTPSHGFSKLCYHHIVTVGSTPGQLVIIMLKCEQSVDEYPFEPSNYLHGPNNRVYWLCLNLDLA